jgi:hypothetical protein
MPAPARPQWVVSGRSFAGGLNVRPIFLGNRIFALLGYELVEGRMTRGSIRETGRTSSLLAGGAARSAEPRLVDRPRLLLRLGGEREAGFGGL